MGLELLEFETLGALRVLANGEELQLGGVRQRAVLGLLVVEAPAAVAVDRLIDELWGARPPPTSAHAVQVYVSALRKTLRVGTQVVTLQKSGGGYALTVHAERVDARRFEQLAREAHHSAADDPDRARELFERALALWRGPPFADLTEFEFARREADRLREVHEGTIAGLAQARMACGEHEEVIPTLVDLVAADPLRERPRRLLMLALYRAGRQADALRTYRDACRALDELGLQPGPELRALEAAILRHDPSLVAPRRGAKSSVVRAFEPQLGTPGAPGFVGTPPARRRKIVTVLCCDVAASRPDGGELDPEALLATTGHWLAELETIVERHGGTVTRSVGDAVIAAFGIARAHEDDALRAVRAAAEIRDRLPAVAAETGDALSFRGAVNTGVVVAGEGEDLATGSAINLAARLAQSAEANEILLDHETFSLVRDAAEVEAVGALSVTGTSEPILAFRLLRVDPLAPGVKRRLDLPLIGRKRELSMLRRALEAVVEERGCHLFTLLGTAGIGKTRLAAELLSSLGDGATVLRGRCLPYGDGITFSPITEALTPVGETAGQVLRQINTGGVATAAELFWEIRQLLETLAADRPLVLHVDDLQWAEPMLLDLLRHVAAMSRGAPILLLCTARPELIEDHPGWGAGKLHASTFLMDALEPTACELLLGHLADDLPRQTREEVTAVSGGNPLFLEELALLAHERGMVGVPSTMQSLLLARLERLQPEERELLEAAAVEGEVFHLDATGQLCASLTDEKVDALLAGLVRKDLIIPHASGENDLQTLAFRHLLIRDAVYHGTTKHTRARLHQAFADWLEHDGPDQRQLEEIAGWHLEQAASFHRELRRAPDTELSIRAAKHLYAAGRRAAQRGDAVAARKLLERAFGLTCDDEALAARVGVELAEQLIEGGDLERVDALLSGAEHHPDTADHARLVRLHWLVLTQPDLAPQKIRMALPDMFPRLAAADDESGLAKAHLAMFWATSQQAFRSEDAGEQARLAAEHARKAGDQGLRSRALGLYIAALVHGPRDAAALTEELDAIEAEGVGPYVAALVTVARGEVKRLEGRLDQARPLIGEGIERFREMRIHTMMASCQNWLGWSELSGGEPASALRELLEADKELAAVGERSFRSTIQATTAQVYERLGYHNRARAAVNVAEELVAPKDHLTLVGLSIVNSRLALLDDDPELAESWAHKAVEHANQTDVPFLQGLAQLQLGRLLSTLGREEEAQAAGLVALELFETKGDEPRLRETREFLAELDVLGGASRRQGAPGFG